MNTRTGWNRRWLQSRNPALEALEARLVLSEAARSGLQPLLSQAEQLGKLANHGVTIDSVFGTKPKADLPFLNVNDLKGSAGSPPPSDNNLSQGSSTEGHAPLVQPPVSQTIEASVAGMAPWEMADVANTFKVWASLAAGDQVPISTHAGGPVPIFKHNSITSQDTTPPTPQEGGTNPQIQTEVAPNSGTGQATERTPPPDRSATESTNANKALAQAAAEVEQATGVPATAPAQPVETMLRQVAPPVIGQGVSYLANPGRFIDGYTAQQRIYDSQELVASDFTALPGDEAAPGGVLSSIDRVALLSETDGEAPSTTSSGDLILNFLPANVAALRTAIENLLTETEQVLLGGATREGLGLGLFIAALVTSGMAGHAVWEHVRGRRERAESPDLPDAWALTRHLAAGLQLSEMP
jgi:hypothetical protein